MGIVVGNGVRCGRVVLLLLLSSDRVVVWAFLASTTVAVCFRVVLVLLFWPFQSSAQQYQTCRKVRLGPLSGYLNSFPVQIY